LPVLTKIMAGGVRWQVTPECRDRLFGPEGLRLSEWLQAGQAHVVKHGPHRTVYRVALPGLSFYLKHNRTTDVGSWLKQWIRPSKARREYDRALGVAGRGIPTVAPLGLGERWGPLGPGDSYLITRSLDGAEPLNCFIDQTLSQLASSRLTRFRHCLARDLGKFIAQIHDAGIVHNDLHAGNLLVRIEPEDQLAFFLIDLHAVQIGHPLGWRASRANLMIWSHWFMIRAGRADRLRFWHSYWTARRNGPATADFFNSARDLEERSWKSTLRLWKTRDRRCLVLNRSYEPIRSAEASGYIVRDFDREPLAPLFDDPEEPLRGNGVKLLKNSPSSTVAELGLVASGRRQAVIYKRFRVTAWKDPWMALLRRPAALRSWIYGHGLRERDLATARPLAVLHRRRLGLLLDGFLLTEKIAGVIELNHFVAGLQQLPAAERRTILRQRTEQVARLVRELHRRQLSHRDLKAANILVGSGQGAVDSGQWTVNSEQKKNQQESERWAVNSEQPRSGQEITAHCSLPTAHCSLPTFPVWLVDLVGVSRHRKLPHKRRLQNLARLHASFHQSPVLTRTDKLRFLRIYLQWGLFGKTGWKAWWREIDRATRDKIARNLSNGRPLG
jgi:tRNA A-37 threonylcarbamoyl transferase component Bud32